MRINGNYRYYYFRLFFKIEIWNMTEPNNHNSDHNNNANSSSDSESDDGGIYEGVQKGEFYDSDEDESNERWVTKHYSAPRLKTTISEDKPGSSSLASVDPDSRITISERPRKHQTDAELNCPACFTLLCVDCQQHVEYENQFRAMFVKNCRVDEETVLTYDAEASGESPEEYNPVYCSECGTQVGVFSPQEEIYHFFNVIPSH